MHSSDLHSNNKRPRVVILGGGFGGLACARDLKGVAADVVLVDKNNYHLFQPLLYQVATAGLTPADIAYPIRSILRRQKNIRVVMGLATAVDRERRVVTLTEGEMPYDYLVVACGMTHNYFGHDEWERYAPGLKDLSDALGMRQHLLSAFEAAEREKDPDKARELMTFVVVGGGPTGVEMAGAIREVAGYVLRSDFRNIDPTKARVILVEAADRLLPPFPESLSAKTRAALEAIDVEILTGRMVKDVREDGVLVDETFIPTRTVIWTAGVKASPVMQSLGVELDRGGRAVVNADLRLPEDERVFVIGDLAKFTTEKGRVLPGLAPVATQQGHTAAANIRRLIAESPTKAFRYRDFGQMATIGRGKAVADIFGLRFGGRPAWMTWLFVHIMYLVGFRNRLSVLLQWTYAYIAVRRSARLIIPRGSQPQGQP
ncbi:MAG: NAD(P)/FAD-dependent oxidoreductase, partial [Deltaproteobacteria bacterium]|nr:NAD(P)/FAD-dependent oxidoreductase [Deltaproteobacteria bacterium]